MLADFENKMKSDVNAMVNNIKGASMSRIGHKKGTAATVAPCPKCGGNIMSGPKGFYCSKQQPKLCKSFASLLDLQNPLHHPHLITLQKNLLPKNRHLSF